MNPGLRITWVLPFLNLTGGVRVVFEYTRELLRRGHQVTLVVPRPVRRPPWTRPGLADLATDLLHRFFLRSGEAVQFYGLGDHVRWVPALEPHLLPEGDVILATAWRTAPVVAQAPASCGRRAYFIQHYEVFEPGDEAVVDATWKLPLEKIVIAGWLARLAAERFGEGAWGPLPNGVDLDLFHARGRIERQPPTVGMMYERIPWKGSADGLEAVRQARAAGGALRLLLYGRPRLRHRLAPGDRYERSPRQLRLAEIYRECDIFLSPSWNEGYGLPPLEAMASGCAVVATNVGGIPDLVVPGQDALTAPPHEPARLAGHLLSLVHDPSLRRRIAAAGHARVLAYGWPRVSDAFERCLLRIAAGESAPRPGGAA